MYVRDVKTKGLINTDINSFTKYKKEREKNREVELLKLRVEQLEKLCEQFSQFLGNNNVS